MSLSERTVSEHTGNAPDCQPIPSPTAGVVFIVDDEPMVTASLQTMLRLETGYQVYAFNHPQAALEACSELRPDVVISDFLMPDMDGIRFLQQVKQQLPETTAILLTGYADKESAIQAINTIGIYRYIQKPWDNDELKITLENALERSRLLSSLQQTITDLRSAQQALESINHQLEVRVRERTQELHVAHQKLESVFQNTADGIVTLDGQGRITGLNVAAHTLFHPQGSTDATPKETPIGKPWQSLIQLNNPNERCELQEGSVMGRAVEISQATLPDQQGIILVIRDITQRKDAERLREDFMSTLTHDLKTPLLAAIQTLGLIPDLAPERQREILTMLRGSFQDLLGLVNVLLEVYRYESGQQTLLWENVSLPQIFSVLAQELEALYQKKEQTLEIILPEGLPTVWGDRQALKRVFTNLLGNAHHYTSTRGHIKVTARVKDGLTIVIQDNGRGIPQKDIGQLFQRFSQGTSKQRNSGTGLGLYLCRQIVEAHGGKIWVESEESVGSCFYVSLPV